MRAIRRLMRAVGSPTRSARGVQRLVWTGLARALPSGRLPDGVWLLGGSSGRAYTDNGAALHRYLTGQRTDIDAVWAIDGDSPDVPLVAAHGPTVDRRSLRAARLGHVADVIIYSHGIRDVPGISPHRRSLVVHLCHGPVLLKALVPRQEETRRELDAAIDLAPVSSELDRAARMRQGLAPDKLPVTGLARWDELMRARRRRQLRGSVPRVLYAPTHRSWHTRADLGPQGALAPVREFLNAPQVRRSVAEGRLELTVFAHQLLQERIGRFPWVPEGLELVTSASDLNDQIASADLVISDYSSIVWDALYLDIPVAFFHFDKDVYERRVPANIDRRGPLFGPIVRHPSEAVDLVTEEKVGDGGSADWQQARRAWQRDVFAFRDDRNCERIAAAIEERLSQ